MATMKSTLKWIYDAHSSVLFRATGQAALTATGTVGPLALAVQNLAYWDNGEQANRELTIAVNVESCDASSNDETYALTAEVSGDSFVTAYEVAHIVIPRGKTGAYTLIVDMDDVQKYGTMTQIRLKATLGGTTPSLAFCAWMAEGDAH